MYYVCLFKMVDLEAVKHDLSGLPPEMIPDLGTSVRKGVKLFVPIILLLVLIGFSGIAYINSHFFVKIFDKYIPEETSEPNPDSVVDHSLDSDNKNL